MVPPLPPVNPATTHEPAHVPAYVLVFWVNESTGPHQSCAGQTGCLLARPCRLLCPANNRGMIRQSADANFNSGDPLVDSFVLGSMPTNHVFKVGRTWSYHGTVVIVEAGVDGV